MRRITVTILFLTLFSTGTIFQAHFCRTNVLYAKNIIPDHSPDSLSVQSCSLTTDNAPERLQHSTTDIAPELLMNSAADSAPELLMNSAADIAPELLMNSAADSAPELLMNSAADSTLELDTADTDSAAEDTDSNTAGRTDAAAEGKTDAAADSKTDSTGGAADPAKESAAEGAMPSLNISSPSVLLMEAETGTILYQKNEHDARPPASVTKIMTLNLIFDAIDKKQIALTDEVTVSETAAAMGGSQVYLEAGEIQTVETLIKCISIASANDACVAMAEYICGSEEEFVAQMNEKAAKLGMNDTHFANSCGLEADGHVTSAYDIALMSRELITKHPQIHDYCTIWMENIIHNTRRGAIEFGLANTNKLLKQYPYATGLKTGYTSVAKFCISATAEKDGIKLIAAIMAAPDKNVRTADAQTLLNYGFSACRIYKDQNPPKLPLLPVRQGSADYVPLTYETKMNYVSTSGEDLSQVAKKIKLPASASAPVKKGDVAGQVTYYLGEKELGHVNILYAQNVEQAAFSDYFMSLVRKLFFLKEIDTATT